MKRGRVGLLKPLCSDERQGCSCARGKHFNLVWTSEKQLRATRGVCDVMCELHQGKQLFTRTKAATNGYASVQDFPNLNAGVLSPGTNTRNAGQCKR